jgi:hypothetical protein
LPKPLSASSSSSRAARFGRAEQIVQDEMEEAAYRVFGVAARALQQYPPPIAGSSYIRSGDLGRGWDRDPHFRIGRGGIGVSLSNPVAYAGLVQGPRQAKIHKERWLSIVTAQDQIEQTYGPLYVNDAMGNIARYLEGGR